MILTCPNCGTQYVVKDGAVPPQGRQVRCANCKHSWHQDPDPEAEPEEGEPTTNAPVADAQPAAMGEVADTRGDVAHDGVNEGPIEAASSGYAHAGSSSPDPALPQEDDFTAVGRVDIDAAPEEESLAEATLIEPRSGPEAEQRAYEEAMIGDGEPAAAVAPVVAQDSDDLPEQQRAEMAPDGFSRGDDIPATAEASGAAATFVADHDSPPAAEPSAAAGLASDYGAPPSAEAGGDDEFSPFAERERAEPRGRNALVSIAMLVVAIAVLAAAFWFLAPPEWRARAGLGDGGKTPLELMITHPDRQKLASGQESLTISGRVINPTDATHAIPPIYAQLKSRSGQTIYSWTIAPPAPSLGPRASTSFNSTEVDVPPGGDDLTISLGPPRA
ncbi:zinc-ribbon domain-containing protein [Sphingomonas sp.]|uniref:zinc-ribbon domain-containing protein n=1 Tax=Sphingomonas sp. TaxID=28214 RepID=UPI00344EC135|nr:zinc-ribbon domain-containing protein [Sphingomonas sp.]